VGALLFRCSSATEGGGHSFVSTWLDVYRRSAACQSGSRSLVAWQFAEICVIHFSFLFSIFLLSYLLWRLWMPSILSKMSAGSNSSNEPAAAHSANKKIPVKLKEDELVLRNTVISFERHRSPFVRSVSLERCIFLISSSVFHRKVK